MIKCIIHTADIHLRNDRRVEEYNVMLAKFCDECRKITSEYKPEECRIVICGDLTHSKSSVSSELFSRLSSFLRELKNICKVIIICGNHDIPSSSSRQDVLSGVAQTMGLNPNDPSDIHYLDMELDYESGVIADDNINWCLYSIFDDFMKPDIIKEEGMTNFGLFHGDIVGSTLYNGMVMSTGVDCDVFDGCDFVLASHIHKYQILRNKGVEVVFPSSLIQQNFGESVSEHGFVVWTLNNDNEYVHTFHNLQNDYGMYKIGVNDVEDVENNVEQFLNI